MSVGKAIQVASVYAKACLMSFWVVILKTMNLVAPEFTFNMVTRQIMEPNSGMRQLSGKLKTADDIKFLLSGEVVKVGEVSSSE